MAESVERAILVDYLLGRLDVAKQFDLEERYLVNEDLHARLKTAERDLIDSYLAGRLNPDERRRFERQFRGSPGRWQEVQLARALMTARPPKRLLYRFRSAWLIPVAGAVAAIFFLALANRDLRRQLDSREPRPTTTAMAPALTARLALTDSGATRGAGSAANPPELRLPKGAAAVELTARVEMIGQMPVDAALLDADGVELTVHRRLKPVGEPRHLVATFAADRFGVAAAAPATYFLRISAAADGQVIASLPFTVRPE